MSDRIAVFNDGRIQQLATPADLYEKPENSFVAQFIGENNRFNGVTRDPRRTGRRRDGNGRIVPALAVRTSVGEPTQLSIRPERVESIPPTARSASRGASRR